MALHHSGTRANAAYDTPVKCIDTVPIMTYNRAVQRMMAGHPRPRRLSSGGSYASTSRSPCNCPILRDCTAISHFPFRQQDCSRRRLHIPGWLAAFTGGWCADSSGWPGMAWAGPPAAGREDQIPAIPPACVGFYKYWSGGSAPGSGQVRRSLRLPAGTSGLLIMPCLYQS